MTDNLPPLLDSSKHDSAALTSAQLTQILYRHSMEDDFLRPFLEALCINAGLRSAVTVLLDKQSRNFKAVWESGNQNQETALSISNALFKKDPLFCLLARAPENTFYATNLDLPDWRKSADKEILTWSKKTGIAEACGAKILIDAQHELLVFLQRSKEDADFSVAEKNLFNEYIPHLQEVCRLRLKNTEAQHTKANSDSIIDVFPIPAFILNRHTEVIAQNSKAARWLQSTNKVRLVNNQLCLSSDKQQNSLAHQVSKLFSAAQEDIGDQLFRWDIGSEPLNISLKPLLKTGQDEPSIAQVLCFVHLAEQSIQPSIWALSQIYHLTEREGDICRHLLNGKDLPATAEVLGISVHTVRDMLKKRIFKKCACRSQNELIAKLLSNPAAYFESL